MERPSTEQKGTTYLASMIQTFSIRERRLCKYLKGKLVAPSLSETEYDRSKYVQIWKRAACIRPMHRPYYKRLTLRIIY